MQRSADERDQKQQAEFLSHLRPATSLLASIDDPLARFATFATRILSNHVGALLLSNPEHNHPGFTHTAQVEAKPKPEPRVYRRSIPEAMSLEATATIRSIMKPCEELFGLQYGDIDLAGCRFDSKRLMDHYIATNRARPTGSVHVNSNPAGQRLQRGWVVSNNGSGYSGGSSDLGVGPKWQDLAIADGRIISGHTRLLRPNIQRRARPMLWRDIEPLAKLAGFEAPNYQPD